jgi:hypothetical protein
MALAHHQLGCFAEHALVYLGLPGHVLVFRVQQRHGKHLGDVVHHGLQQQYASVFCPKGIIQQVERLPEQLRPDVVVNPAGEFCRVHLQLRLGEKRGHLVTLG